MTTVARLPLIAIALALLTLPAVLLGQTSDTPFNFDDPKKVNSVQFILDSELEPIMGYADGITGSLDFDPEKPQKLKGWIELTSASVNTTNARMKKKLDTEEWLAVESHPKVRFDVQNIKEVKSPKANEYQLVVEGEFLLKGVKKPIEAPATLTYLPGKLEERQRGKQGDLLVLRSIFKLKRSDFGVGPAYPVVSDDMKIQVAIVGYREKSKKLGLAPEGTTSETSDQLLIALQKERSSLELSFERDHLPAIRDAASELGVNLKIVDLEASAPESVHLTPLIIFQNHRGRSIYQGRYTTVPRIKNFVDTSRWVPQSQVPLEREEVLLLERGRLKIAFVLKVTETTGQPPSDLTTREIREQIAEMVAQAIPQAERVSRAQLDRSDRTFYFDFYPYRSGAGEFFIASALYSQFNCHIPVAEYSGSEARGDLPTATKTAAKSLFRAFQAVIKDSDSGDGFRPVPTEFATVSWKELGLELPEAPEEAVPTPDFKIPSRWVLLLSGAGTADPTRLQFAFLPPLDSYAGEVENFSGTLILGPEARLEDTRGGIEVQVESVTMGEPDLDESILASDTLNAKKFPRASFTIESVSPDRPQLEIGESVNAVLRGTFEMKGKQLPLETRCSFDTLLSAKGEPRLRATGSFSIRLLERFGIYGPDGPAPANDTLEFNYTFIYGPASNSQPRQP